MNTKIPRERIKLLNDEDVRKGEYVVYWMQASCRVHYNHALEYALEQSNHLKLPLIVYFGLTDDFPEANFRHYSFLVEGLHEVEDSLEKMGIKFIVMNKSPELGLLEIADNASLIVTDRGYLDIQRDWREFAARKLGSRLVQVESDIVVPVETTSPKEEYAAATIRRKIHDKLHQFLKPVKDNSPIRKSLEIGLGTVNLNKILKNLNVDRSVDISPNLTGGTSHAMRNLDEFIKIKLDRFADLRNDPSQEYLSNLSPYIHFGHISPLYIALQVSKTDSPGRDAYLEELIVRRELSVNFTHYNPNYKNIKCLPNWAGKTLKDHANDPRPYIYSLKELEDGRTHDPYWNAAQMEMVYTGKMQGYMRMYWGKKIIEWTSNPRDAYEIMLYLNNKYEMDGRDPNGYTGVAWCFGKHDRAWKERKIFGKVRYMNDKGLERKFKIKNYVDRVDGIIELIEEGLWP